MEKKESHIGTVVAVSLAGLALWHLGLKYLYAYRRLSYKIDRIRIVPSGGRTASVQLHLLVANPTNVEAYVDGLEADVYFNGLPVGRVDNLINRRMYRQSVSQFALNFNINITDLIGKMLDDMQSTIVQEWNVRLAGTLRADGRELPIDLTLSTQSVEQIVQ